MQIFTDLKYFNFTETAKRCLDLIDRLSEAEDSLENVTKHRNITIVLGCLAEKLAGPRSVELLNKKTLDFLISNLDPDRPPPIILFSLIALEKFSQTSENKVTLAKKFKTFLSDHHPLMILETRFLYSSNFVSRQVKITPNVSKGVLLEPFQYVDL